VNGAFSHAWEGDVFGIADLPRPVNGDTMQRQISHRNLEDLVMFRLVPRIAFLCWLSSQAAAQDDKPQPPMSSPPVTSLASYVIQVTELHTNVPIDAKMDSKELLGKFEQLKKDGTVELLETVRLSALDGQESMAQFGRQAAVTAGTSQVMPGRAVRNIQMREVGTLVRVTVQRHEGKVLLNLTYEASRLGEQANQDSPPDVATVSCKTTLAVGPGQMVLAGSMFSATSTLLLVSVEE
jgi:hypothetical protein